MAFKAKTGKKSHRSHATEEAVKEMNKEPMKGFHVTIPASLHTAFKTKTATNGESMKDVLLKLITGYVEK